MPPLKKALQTILLTLLIAAVSLAAALGLMAPLPPRADADPNTLLARATAPYLKDGRTFALADAYPDAWETVQLVSGGERLDPWTWRALRAFDAGLSERMEGGQLLVFWHGGAVTRMVGFNARENGMPWFVIGQGDTGGAILPRKDAVFLVTLTREAGTAYYVCAPVGAEEKV